MDIVLPLLLQIALIALNAIFACAEIAVLQISDAKLTKLAGEGNRRAKRLMKIKEDPARLLATIQVAITLAGFLGSAFAASNFAEPIVRNWFKLSELDQSYSLVYNATVVVITLLLSFVTLVFGELVPKRVAMKYSEKIGLGMSGLISFFAFVFTPVVWFLTVCTNGVLRMMRIDPNETEEKVDEEEILMMVDVGSEAGNIDDEEREMIQNVFEFDDMTVAEFATHRTDMVILWAEDSIETWAETIHETRHAIYPICNESPDDLVGLLNAKDFFRYVDEGRETVMREAVKPVYFVPENLKADMLFRQMKETRNRFAVVLDEYGGVFGIVTMNDILEQIVGGFEEDSIKEEEQEIVLLEENRWRVKGSASLDDVIEKLNVTLDKKELDPTEYDTFGGLVFGQYGTIPTDGSTFSIDIGNSLTVDVRKILDHRIEEAVVTVTPPEPEEKEIKEKEAKLFSFLEKESKDKDTKDKDYKDKKDTPPEGT